MVTPHLPPHQAANALLPHLLGQGLAERGHAVQFLTFGPPAGPRVADATLNMSSAEFTSAVRMTGVSYVRRRSRRLGVTRIPQALEAVETWVRARPLIAAADVVHVHSSTWMNHVAARLAVGGGTPYVLTHYGTEIWHHDGRDAAFRRFNRDARHVSFYSRALMERAAALAVPVRAGSVIYPPVADSFRPLPPRQREAVRRRYAPSGGPLLLNVKRLHPLADHHTLLRAMEEVLRARPDATLLIAGAGGEEAALKAHAARLGLGESVRFLGLVPNDEVAMLQGGADLFVLSSVLEATPTVALEALACGTPVLSTDNPGGVELQETFGEDVEVVPKQDAPALAGAVLRFLASPRRTRPRSDTSIEERFRLPGVVDRYLALYREAAGP
jgi:glycosyltransferase involved in cell wall biosynthesis